MLQDFFHVSERQLLAKEAVGNRRARLAAERHEQHPDNQYNEDNADEQGCPRVPLFITIAPRTIALRRWRR